MAELSKVQVLIEIENLNKIIEFTPKSGVPDLDVVFEKLAELADRDDELATKIAGHLEFKKFNKKYGLYLDFHKSNLLTDGDRLKVVNKDRTSSDAEKTPTPPPSQPSFDTNIFQQDMNRLRQKPEIKPEPLDTPNFRDRSPVRSSVSQRESFNSNNLYERPPRPYPYGSGSNSTQTGNMSYNNGNHASSSNMPTTASNSQQSSSTPTGIDNISVGNLLRGKKNAWTWQEILEWEEKAFQFKDNSKYQSQYYKHFVGQVYIVFSCLIREGGF